MKLAASLLAAIFVPFAVLAGMQRADAPETASLTAAVALGLGVGAIAFWVGAEWMARRVR